jgi:hypothetical protein
MELSERIVTVANEQDRQLLEEIARQDGDTSMSATVRRLIRDEAQRRGIQADVVSVAAYRNGEARG